jgi:hypothetical protein
MVTSHKNWQVTRRPGLGTKETLDTHVNVDKYLICPARSGLIAYSQSWRSFSFRVWIKYDLCLVVMLEASMVDGLRNGLRTVHNGHRLRLKNRRTGFESRQDKRSWFFVGKVFYALWYVVTYLWLNLNYYYMNVGIWKRLTSTHVTYKIGWPGDVAQWTSHSPQKQKTRARIPPGCKVF